jgi:hypothetical protein
MITIDEVGLSKILMRAEEIHLPKYSNLDFEKYFIKKMGIMNEAIINKESIINAYLDVIQHLNDYIMSWREYYGDKI